MLALFADSTNIDRPRRAPARRPTSSDAFDEVFATTEGKLVVASFASSVYRMQLIVDLAAQFDRQVAFVGRGMRRELARSRSASATCACRPASPMKDSDVGSLPAGRRASAW